MGMADNLVELLKEAKEEAMKVSGGDVFEAEWMAAYLSIHGVTIPVECGECKHFHHDDDVLAQHCRLFGAMMGVDDFCSCGERRTDV